MTNLRDNNAGKQWSEKKIKELDRIYKNLQEKNNGCAKMKDVRRFFKTLYRMIEDLELTDEQEEKFDNSICTNSISYSLKKALGIEDKKDDLIITDKKQSAVENFIDSIEEEKIKRYCSVKQKKSGKEEKSHIDFRRRLYFSKENKLYVSGRKDRFLIITSEKLITLLKIINHQYIKTKILTEICGYKNSKVMRGKIRDLNIRAFKYLLLDSELIVSDRLKIKEGYKLQENYKIEFCQTEK